MNNLSIRQVITGTLVVVGVAFLFWFLFRFHNLFLMLFAALIISTAMHPLVFRLNQQFGLSRTSSTVIVYGLLLCLVVVGVWLGAPFFIDQTATVGRTLGEVYEVVRQTIASSGNLIARRLAIAMPTDLPSGSVATTEDQDVLDMLNQVSEVATMVFRVLLGIVATFLLAFYWTIESERIKRGLVLIFSQEKRTIARDIIANVEEKLSNYVIGQGILVLAIGVLALIAYLLIGLPHALTLAIFAGLMEAVPLIGPLLGAIPAALVALSLSPAHMLWVIVATTIIQQLENIYLVPRVMDRAVGVRPLVTLLAMYAFGSLFGVVGVLIAIPLAAVVQLFLDYFVLQRTAVAEENGRDKNSVLRYAIKDLVQDIRGQVRRKTRVATATNDQIEDSIEAIALDLDSFLAQNNAVKAEQA